MDANKFLEMRRQIEENNQDLRDFLGDFDKWKSEVEEKSLKLKGKLADDDNLPPIRNILFKKRRKKTNSKKKSDNKINDRIKSYDYKAWDKFDVDKALEEIDASESVISESKSETDEEWENERRLKLSEVEKDEGNRLFKDGKYEEAVDKYTTAIRLAPENPLLYTNRAIALYKLERYASSESDCSIAISMNAKLVKGFYRRAQARKALGKVEEAISDLKRILDIEPRNSAALKDLSTWTGEVDLRAGSINSLYKLIDVSEATSFSDLCRIKISEVGSEEALVKSQKKSTKSTPSVDGPTSNSPNPRLLKEPPTNWFQLERDLKELIPSDDSLTPQAVDYLCSLEPQNYKSVIGGSLTSSCLGRLVRAMVVSSSLSSTQKAERLKSLANLPRFSVAWMLAEDSNRQAVDKLLQEMPTELSESLKLLFV
nr:RNA polymerase II associated protein 3 [Hymenolepis microstoma]